MGDTVELVFDIICSSGLDGITYDDIWSIVESERNYFFKDLGLIDFDLKRYIIKRLIVNSKINIYSNSHDSGDLKSSVKAEENIKRINVPINSIYEKNKKEYGCCELYYSRKDITSVVEKEIQINNMDFLDFSSKNIKFVALQISRNLVLNYTVRMIHELAHFCFLEIIGRTRYKGFNQTDFSAFGVDPKSSSYTIQKLIDDKLIVKLDLGSNQEGFPHNVLLLRRYYRPDIVYHLFWLNPTDTLMNSGSSYYELIHKSLSCIKSSSPTIKCLTKYILDEFPSIAIYEIRNTIAFLYNEKLINIKDDNQDIIDAQQFRKMFSASIHRWCLTSVGIGQNHWLNNDNDHSYWNYLIYFQTPHHQTSSSLTINLDSNHNVPSVHSFRFPFESSPIATIYHIFESTKNYGLSIKDLEKIIGVDYYGSRAIVRNATTLKLVKPYTVVDGKSREYRFVLYKFDSQSGGNCSQSTLARLDGIDREDDNNIISLSSVEEKVGLAINTNPKEDCLGEKLMNAIFISNISKAHITEQKIKRMKYVLTYIKEKNDILTNTLELSKKIKSDERNDGIKSPIRYKQLIKLLDELIQLKLLNKINKKFKMGELTQEFCMFYLILDNSPQYPRIIDCVLDSADVFAKSLAGFFKINRSALQMEIQNHMNDENYEFDLLQFLLDMEITDTPIVPVVHEKTIITDPEELTTWCDFQKNFLADTYIINYKKNSWTVPKFLKAKLLHLYLFSGLYDQLATEDTKYIPLSLSSDVLFTFNLNNFMSNNLWLKYVEKLPSHNLGKGFFCVKDAIENMPLVIFLYILGQSSGKLPINDLINRTDLYMSPMKVAVSEITTFNISEISNNLSPTLNILYILRLISVGHISRSLPTAKVSFLLNKECTIYNTTDCKNGDYSNQHLISYNFDSIADIFSYWFTLKEISNRHYSFKDKTDNKNEESVISWRLHALSSKLSKGQEITYNDLSHSLCRLPKSFYLNMKRNWEFPVKEQIAMRTYPHFFGIHLEENIGNIKIAYTRAIISQNPLPNVVKNKISINQKIFISDINDKLYFTGSIIFKLFPNYGNWYPQIKEYYSTFSPLIKNMTLVEFKSRFLNVFKQSILKRIIILLARAFKNYKDIKPLLSPTDVDAFDNFLKLFPLINLKIKSNLIDISSSKFASIESIFTKYDIYSSSDSLEPSYDLYLFFSYLTCAKIIARQYISDYSLICLFTRSQIEPNIEDLKPRLSLLCRNFNIEILYLSILRIKKVGIIGSKKSCDTSTQDIQENMQTLIYNELSKCSKRFKSNFFPCQDEIESNKMLKSCNEKPQFIDNSHSGDFLKLAIMHFLYGQIYFHLNINEDVLHNTDAKLDVDPNYSIDYFIFPPNYSKKRQPSFLNLLELPISKAKPQPEIDVTNLYDAKIFISSSIKSIFNFNRPSSIESLKFSEFANLSDYSVCTIGNNEYSEELISDSDLLDLIIHSFKNYTYSPQLIMKTIMVISIFVQSYNSDGVPLSVYNAKVDEISKLYSLPHFFISQITQFISAIGIILLINLYVDRIYIYYKFTKDWLLYCDASINSGISNERIYYIPRIYINELDSDICRRTREYIRSSIYKYIFNKPGIKKEMVYRHFLPYLNKSDLKTIIKCFQYEGVIIKMITPVLSRRSSFCLTNIGKFSNNETRDNALEFDSIKLVSYIINPSIPKT